VKVVCPKVAYERCLRVVATLRIPPLFGGRICYDR
jgi:hypothetical protein